MFPGRRIQFTLIIFVFTIILIRIYDFLVFSTDNKIKCDQNISENSIEVFLYDIKAFNVDIQLFKYIIENNKRSHADIDLFPVDKIVYLKLGLFENYVRKLNDSIKKHNIKAEINYYYETNYQDVKIVSSVYMKIKNIHIQMSVFYKRNDFYWIATDNHKYNTSETTKYFGDITRAVNSFQLNTITDRNLVSMLIPLEIEQFLYDYKHSRFIECNRKLADSVDDKYRQNLTRNLIILKDLKEIKSVLEGSYKNYWLAAGTLLGWYRECGIIKHTFDIDFALWSNELVPNIRDTIFKKGYALRALEIGMFNDSYEFRLLGRSLLTIDLFAVYKLNETYQYNAFQSGRNVFRQLIINFNETNLCSAELVMSKFIIPCNPVEYLNAQYGPNWAVPKEDSYQHLLKYDKTWSQDEWLFVARFYNHDGTEDVKETLIFLNKDSKTLITKIPPRPLNYGYT